MFVQNLIEDAAATIVSSSLATNNVTGWQINKGMDTNVNTFPCVKVVCHGYETQYKEVNAGFGKASLELMTCGIKAIGDAGQGTAAADFEEVSDIVFNPFLANDIAAALSTAKLNVMLVSDAGLDVTTLTDGWIATQRLEVVCSRSS